MQLPASWVDALFARLQVRYGTAWNNMWQGVDLAAVKADWAEELGGFGGNTDAIKRALDHLPPDRPPTVGQFRALCIGAPGDVYERPKRLEAPSTSPEVVAAVKEAFKPAEGRDPRFWAHALRKRDQLGERLSMFQRQSWREALRTDDPAAVGGVMTPVAPECLPPGMRP